MNKHDADALAAAFAPETHLPAGKLDLLNRELARRPETYRYKVKAKRELLVCWRSKGKDAKCSAAPRSRLVARVTEAAFRTTGRHPYTHNHWVVTDADTYVDGRNNSGERVQCECGAELRWARVQGVHKPDHACNAKCLFSKGVACECSCGGANHGAGFGS